MIKAIATIIEYIGLIFLVSIILYNDLGILIANWASEIILVMNPLLILLCLFVTFVTEPLVTLFIYLHEKNT